MEKDVFISYKAEEFQEADWVKTTLEKNGITCWMAPACIPGGASYASEIPAAIKKCKVFVLILSRKCQESKWVPRELDQAINESKIIMPFMLENCPLRDEFNFYLSNVQRYAAYESKAATIEKMIKEIKALIGVGSEKEGEQAAARDTAEIMASEESLAEKGLKPVESTGEIGTEPEEPKKNTEEGIVSGNEKKEQKKGENEKPGGRKIRLTAPAIIGAVFVCIIGLVIGCRQTNRDNNEHIYEDVNKLIICGKEYNATDTSVYLSDSDISGEDLKNISAMEKLSTLSLTNCVIKEENINGILGTELAYLNLSGCNLTAEQLESLDFSATKIHTLDLSDNSQLRSLDRMEPLKDSLSILKINNASVSDIEMLASFSKMTELQADNNAISDITPLSNCTRLNSVSLDGNEISDLSAFLGCPGLQKLSINANKLKSLDGLERCIELRILEAGSNEISSLEGLSNATILERVFLNNNKLEDISALGKSALHIQRLYLRNNSVSDISCLKNFTELVYISLDNNNITSLEALAGSKNLEGVSAMGNKIENTKGIEGLSGLNYLYLADNEITEVGVTSPLMFKADGFGSGAYLDLSGNNLISVNITCPPKFRFLGLSDCTIQNASFLYGTEISYLVIDYDSKIDFSALGEAVTMKCVIAGCPLDQQLNVKDALGAYLGSYGTTFVDAGESAYSIEDYLFNEIMGNPEYYQ